jgi:hypothetical protein
MIEIHATAARNAMDLMINGDGEKYIALAEQSLEANPKKKSGYGMGLNTPAERWPRLLECLGPSKRKG